MIRDDKAKIYQQVLYDNFKNIVQDIMKSINDKQLTDFKISIFFDPYKDLCRCCEPEEIVELVLQSDKCKFNLEEKGVLFLVQQEQSFEQIFVDYNSILKFQDHLNDFTLDFGNILPIIEKKQETSDKIIYIDL